MRKHFLFIALLGQFLLLMSVHSQESSESNDRFPSGFAPEVDVLQTNAALREYIRTSKEGLFSEVAITKIGNVEIFYKDHDRNLADSCEVSEFRPIEVRALFPEQSCYCEQGKCFISGIAFPQGFSGRIDFNLKIKDQDGWGKEKGIHVNIPLYTENSTSQILYYGAIFLIGIAAFIIARVIFSEEEQFKASETLEDADTSQKKQSEDFLLKISRPFYKRYFTPVAAGMKGLKRNRGKYKHLLASSGLTEKMSVEDFYGLKLFLIIGFPITFLALRWFLEESWPLSAIPIIGVLGFFYPDFWVKGKIEKRQKTIIAEMPFIVDLLALSVEAGLDTMAAITRVVEKAPAGALKDEFEILLKEIRVGASRSEALRNLAWRINLIQISSFCATLIAADAVGAPIPPILKAQSEEIRQKRSALAEKEGAKAPTKMLIPMMVFILPAVFIVVFAPMILEVLGF